LNWPKPILRAIADEGYETPTPIQEKSIPPMLDGRDLLGVAQTGTGKTAAFALPLLHRLSVNSNEGPSPSAAALILAPTRELASQIGDSLRTYGRHVPLRSTTVFGGASIRPQIKTLARGVHILVATPGRLIDLMNRGHLQLDAIEVFILDEADRMLDMGFIRDVKKIAAAMPARRQTMLFSATMPKSVQGLAGGLLCDPVRVEAAPTATTAENVEQRVLFVAKDKKRALLGELLKDKGIERVLIFTRTKHGANRVAQHLHQSGVKSDAIHGNKAQNARQRALGDFRSGRIRALVATDIAARGIDVDGRDPRHQLRSAQRSRKLCAPHRADGARRGDRHRHLVLRSRRTGLPARHRKDHPPERAGGRGPPIPRPGNRQRHQSGQARPSTTSKAPRQERPGQAPAQQAQGGLAALKKKKAPP